MSLSEQKGLLHKVLNKHYELLPVKRTMKQNNFLYNQCHDDADRFLLIFNHPLISSGQFDHRSASVKGKYMAMPPLTLPSSMIV